MNFQEFMQAVLVKIREQAKDAESVDIREVRKNNDILLHGLTICVKGCNVTPTIYLEPFYKLCLKGMDMEEIISKIWRLYEEGKPKSNISMEFFRDFEKVKDRIVYRLVNAGHNQELLKDVPSIPFWDLAICFYYAFWSEELGSGMILIHNSHMESWGVDHKQLMQLATENTPKLFPMLFVSMGELFQLIEVEMEPGEAEEEELYILTNKEKLNGATVLIYPDTLEKIAKRLKGDFYIIPSSVHEMLVLRAENVRKELKDGQKAGEVLYDMISDVNRHQLRAEEVLSDNPFFYDSKSRQLVQLQEDAHDE